MRSKGNLLTERTDRDISEYQQPNTYAKKKDIAEWS